jgi:manganese/zinc/iron transport system substrate-binding protein
MRNIYIAFLAAAFIVFGCQPQETVSTGTLQVVATTGMVADLAKNIGGDSIEVKSLMGPGVDPHLYKATQGNLADLQQADLVLYNGLHLEGKMTEIFEKLNRIKPVVPIAQGIDSATLIDASGYDTPDPHIWFDVSMWANTIPTVQKALSEARPDLAKYFEKNAQSYQQKLMDLHQMVKDSLSTIPEERRILITAHDAFSYFGRAYDIEVRGLQGISTLSEFGLRDRVDLVDFIVDKKIKAVFVETSVSDKNIKAIVEGAQQKGHEVKIGGYLYSDAMGEAGTEEGTYIGMVKANVKTIVEGLR